MDYSPISNNNDGFSLKLDDKNITAYLEELGPDANVCKNKRSKLTPRQLAYLEATFKTNSSPNHKLRILISQTINMPERSIQIWFQNRRAKIRNGQRKQNLILQEEALRQHYLAAKGQDFTSSRGSFSEFSNSNGMNMGMPGYNSSPMPNTSQFSPFVGQSPYFDMSSATFSTPQINSASNFETNNNTNNTTSNGIISCMILAVGSWQRMASGSESLICGYSVETKQMSWMIGSQDMKFRIRFPFNNVEKIELSFNDSVYAELVLDLIQPPEFASFINGNWVSCPDFSEGQQATNILRHVLKGEAQALRTQFFEMLSAVPEFGSKASIRPTQISNVQQLSASQMEARRRQSDSLIAFDNTNNNNRTDTYPPISVADNVNPFNLGYDDYTMKDPFTLDRSRSLSLPTINPNTNGTSNYFNDDSFNFPQCIEPSVAYNEASL